VLLLGVGRCSVISRFSGLWGKKWGRERLPNQWITVNKQQQQLTHLQRTQKNPLQNGQREITVLPLVNASCPGEVREKLISILWKQAGIGNTVAQKTYRIGNRPIQCCRGEIPYHKGRVSSNWPSPENLPNLKPPFPLPRFYNWHHQCYRCAVNSVGERREKRLLVRRLRSNKVNHHEM
jgi:hypothetical protein